MKIAVTEPEYSKGEAIFASPNNEMVCIPVPDDENSLASSILSHQAKHAIVGTKKYSGQLYDVLPRRGVIARFGVAYDGIDIEKAKEAALYCTNTPGVLDSSVAELTLGLILICARHLNITTNSTKNGQWRPILGSELRNKTLAVIGCGAIGREVAKIAAFGFQMKVKGHDIRDLDDNRLKREYGFSEIVGEFSRVVGEADFVSLHMPLTESTEKFFDSERLNMMQAHAWLINTSRGKIVDEAALFRSLQSGKIAGAALDVFINEPYQPVDKHDDLRLLDNMIFTPHIGSTTNEACKRMASRCLQNIKFAEKGEYDKMDIVASP